ncbi:MAG TPA: hypothetical protein VF121_07165 [Thermoanaerobaculia bacterium]|nr:hypothetical protein [Thermoanaerobaculia bacterium]
MLREVAGKLATLVLRLESLTTALPRSGEEDSMLELLIPSDVPTEVRTTIECVLHDDLRPAIRALTQASEVTEEELRRDFQGARRSW